MATARHRFDGIDWDEVLRRLLLEACRLFGTARLSGQDAVLAGLGVSPRDLVHETVRKLLEDETVQYRRRRGDLVPFLKTVMRNDFVDLLRRASHKTTQILDPIDSPRRDADGVPQTLDSFPGPTSRSPDIIWTERVRALAADDPELVEYVESIVDIGLSKPSDIADLLSTTVNDVLNRRRRLRTRFAKAPELRRAVIS